MFPNKRLCKCWLKKIREIRNNQDYFKPALDLFLSTVPDEQKLGKLGPIAVCRLMANQSNINRPLVSLNWHSRPPKKCLQSNRHLIVNLKKEANWLQILRKRRIGFKFKMRIGFQFEERVNQPPVTIHPTSVSQKKKRMGEVC